MNVSSVYILGLIATPTLNHTSHNMVAPHIYHNTNITPPSTDQKGIGSTTMLV